MFSPTSVASAEKTILLQYRARSAQVPLADLQVLVETGEASAMLQNFFQDIPLDIEETRETLSTRVYDGQIPISSRGVEFVSIQLGTFIGDVLGRERRDDMQQALRDSFIDDRQITILEIIENYPDSTIRVSLNQLTQLYSDLTLFVERIEPILTVIEDLLPELVCDCEFEEGTTAAIGQPANQLASLLSPAISYQNKRTDEAPLACNRAIALEKQVEEASSIPLIPLPLDGRSRLPDPIAETVVITFGPLRPSFKIRDLEQFIETGEVPSGWRFYFNVTGLNEEEFRTALTEEVEADVSLINGWLNNILGEYLLFQVGTIIHTPSGNANIQAIRSAIVLSAIDDGKISLFEFLQNYPAPAVVVEGVNLARFGANLSRRGIIDTVTGTTGLEHMLLELQADVADDICNCTDEDSS
ncbi:MAG: alpha/beta hydrolase [Elainellaceae cyanobacterium]